MACPAVQLLDVAGPFQVFATCNDRLGVAARPYAPRVVARGAASVATSSGLALAVEPLPAVDVEVDTLVVAGGTGIEAAARTPRWWNGSGAGGRRPPTGLTPAHAVERPRGEVARRVLVETRLPLKCVAARCGFGSEETMRRAFLRLLAITPGDYRGRFAI